MNQLKLVEDAEVLGPDDVALAEHAAVIRALGKRVVGDVIEIGRHLAACKAILKEERRWLAWIESEFQWSRNTAENLINVHAMLRDKVSNFDSLNLPISSLYLLAAPSTPPGAHTEVIERAEAGEHLNHAQVKEIVNKTVAEARAAERPAVEAQMAQLRQDADRREAAVRAEYAGKLFIEPEQLQAEVDKVVQPLRKQIAEYQTKLEKIAKAEQDRIDRDREERSKQASKGAEKGVGIDSQMSLDETRVRRALRDLAVAVLKITPAQMMKIAKQSAKATEQTIDQWLDQAPSNARASSDGLRSSSNWQRSGTVRAPPPSRPPTPRSSAPHEPHRETFPIYGWEVVTDGQWGRHHRSVAFAIEHRACPEASRQETRGRYAAGGVTEGRSGAERCSKGGG
jgi:Protein of unknown function (DUF3102)